MLSCLRKAVGLIAVLTLPAPLLDPPQLTSHVLMVLPAAAIGIIAGLCAIMFTTINLKVLGVLDLLLGLAGLGSHLLLLWLCRRVC
jgi:hypothetical protein